jgi:2-oxoglutarate ferredoxin oxidoreductase subunit delta
MPHKGTIEVDEALCKGCGLCIKACPQKVLGLSNGRTNSKGYSPAEIIAEGCTACTVCAVVCPDTAIIVYRFKVDAVLAGGAP